MHYSETFGITDIPERVKCSSDSMRAVMQHQMSDAVFLRVANFGLAIG